MGCGASRNMGAGASSAPSTSTIVVATSGDNGGIRRHSDYTAELKLTAFPGEVTTAYDVFQ